jgi:hypothetical protein
VDEFSAAEVGAAAAGAARAAAVSASFEARRAIVNMARRFSEIRFDLKTLESEFRETQPVCKINRQHPNLTSDWNLIVSTMD